MEIQELVSRARMLLLGAPKRVLVFQLINGKRSTQEISLKAGRPLTSVLHDLQKMRDMGIISPKKTSAGKELLKNGYSIYEKHTLIKHISPTYFQSPEKIQKLKPRKGGRSKTKRRSTALRIPTEKEIIDICRNGEDQSYEFKEAGVEMNKLSKEICAFANTRIGGYIFYGVDDNGRATGTDKSRQAFDPGLHNSIKNMISPTVNVHLSEKNILGVKILVIAVPSRDPDEVHMYNSTVYIRKGTVSMPATSSEVKKMYRGQYII